MSTDNYSESKEDAVKSMVEALQNGGSVIACSVGCCYGCQNCYGMAIGCHQDPCRCSFPCICDFSEESWQVAGCERHDPSHDNRHQPDPGAEYSDRGVFEMDLEECPVCHEIGPCGFDGEGRPMLHMLNEDDFADFSSPPLGAQE